MKDILLEIGCEGGIIRIKRVLVNGIFLFKISSSDYFEMEQNKSSTYITLRDSWMSMKLLYPQWYQLYLVNIDSQMIDLLKADYLAVSNKNEDTKERWLQHLIGFGIGF